MHQVIIIGAGPAGAFLAYLLARAKISVLLLEKERLPRYKLCAGGVSPKACRFVDFSLEPVIEDEISTVVLTHNQTRPITITRDLPVVYTVSRDRFDAFLVDRAVEAGAEVRDRVRINKVEVTGDGVSVSAAGKQWDGLFLAGADGAFSVVARTLRLARKKRVAITLEKEVPVSPERLARNRGRIKVDYGLAPGTFTWVFPKADRLSLGAGSISPRFKGLHSLLGKVIHAEGLADSVSVLTARGWIIPYNPKPDNLHRGRALVVGDAAGLADALTGEGIYAALYSARLAAEVISAQMRKLQPDLREYTDLVRRTLGPEMLTAYRIARLFYPAPGLFHRFLERQPDLADAFIRTVAGDLTYAEFFRSCIKRFPTAFLKTAHKLS
ncbi:MAG: geranylgeranyl reductase family protein [Bacillota bacterium]